MFTESKLFHEEVIKHVLQTTCLISFLRRICEKKFDLKKPNLNKKEKQAKEKQTKNRKTNKK